MSFDLDSYLDRVGLGNTGAEPPSLAAVHQAHVTSIPFENLDPRRGVPVSLDPADLERKLVHDRRGGYCFEQNLLLKLALEALGYEVEPLLARVRYGSDPGVLRPRSHVVLRIYSEGAVWHADVGFGLGTLLEPIPFGPGGEYDQAGWRFRVADEDGVLVLQRVEDGGWVDLYGFEPETAPHADLEVSNWFTSTHPRSPFVTGLVVATQSADGTRTALTDWGGALTLTEDTPGQSDSRAVLADELPSLLAERFGLVGVDVEVEGAEG